MIDSPDNDAYVQAWNEGETPEPAKEVSVLEDVAPPVSEARVAADAAREKDAKEFSDAFHADEPKVEAPKPTSFKQAFAKARLDGAKVFDWNGKKYTTQLKSDAAPAAAPGDSKALEAADAARHKPKAPAAKTLAPGAGPDDKLVDQALVKQVMGKH